jgi:hypothetical protein
VLAFNSQDGSARVHFEIPEELVGESLSTDGQSLYLATSDLAGKFSIVKMSTSAGASSELVFDGGELRHFRSFAILDSLPYLARGHRISRIEGGKEIVVAGADEAGCQEGVGVQARFTDPFGLASDGRYLYVGDIGCHTVSRIDPKNGAVVRLVGDPDSSNFQEGQGRNARIPYPRFLAVEGDVLFVSDSREGTVAKIDLN